MSSKTKTTIDTACAALERHSKETRRMTKQEAIELGAKDGEADVRDVHAEQGVEALRVCQAPGHVAWDEGAISAGAAQISGVPDEFRSDYYESYRTAASKLADRLIDEAQC